MYSEKIAIQLFQYTDYMLFSCTREKLSFSVDGRFRDKEVGESWDDYQYLAEDHTNLLATKASWDDFTKEDFNYQVISNFEKGRYIV